MSRGLSKQQWEMLKTLARRGTEYVGGCASLAEDYDNMDWEAYWMWDEGGRVGPNPADRPGTQHSRLNNAKRGLRSLERRGLVTLEVEAGHRDPLPNPFTRIAVRDRTKATITEAGRALVVERHPECLEPTVNPFPDLAPPT